MVWTGSSIKGHTDLHVVYGGILTVVRYRYEIIDPSIHPYAAVIVEKFILMDDNAQNPQAAVVEYYLEGHGLERMNCLELSPNLNAIEHLWDYPCRKVDALIPPPRSLPERERARADYLPASP